MKIICIGRNYTAHIEELDNERPTEPIIFTKPETALLRDNKPFYYPDFSDNIHHEIELVIRINRNGKSIEREYAHKYFDEVALGVDFTARDIQDKAREKGLPWAIAKGFNGSAPLSAFHPISEVGGDFQNIDFGMKLNGVWVQQGNSKLMIWNISEQLAYISKFILLKAGDIIFTGTPKGVGPVKLGDRVEGFVQDNKWLDFEVK